MKFKALFISFNIVLLLSFVTVFLLPMLVLGGSFMLEFWSKNWFFGAIFLFVFLAVNAVFLSYWKMLSYLEKEDWPGLSQYLESEVFERKRYNSRKVRLLCDSLLLLGDFATVGKLEELLRSERPRLFSTIGIRFVAACLLSGDYGRMMSLIAELRALKCPDGEWLGFYAAFSGTLRSLPDEAATGFMPLATAGKEPLVVALSGYLAGDVLAKKLPARQTELSDAADSARARLSAKYSRKKWAGYVEDMKADMHVVVLGKLIDESNRWLFPQA